MEVKLSMTDASSALHFFRSRGVESGDEHRLLLDTLGTDPLALLPEASRNVVDTRLFTILRYLSESGSTHNTFHVRDSIMIISSNEHACFELEMFADGHMDVERFDGYRQINNPDALAKFVELLRSQK